MITKKISGYYAELKTTLKELQTMLNKLQTEDALLNIRIEKHAIVLGYALGKWRCPSRRCVPHIAAETLELLVLIDSCGALEPQLHSGCSRLTELLHQIVQSE